MKIIKKRLTFFMSLALCAMLGSFVFGASSPVKADTATYFAGTWSGNYNGIDLKPTVAGEFLFSYNNGCKYPLNSDFSHVALVLKGSSTKPYGWWDGPLIESTNAVSKGETGFNPSVNSVTTAHFQTKFHYYDYAALGYFYKSGIAYHGTDVVSKAVNYKGPYDWKSSFGDNSKWYCSKLVSRAVYDNYKYNLGFKFWGSFIPPGSVYWDSAIHQISHASSSTYDHRSVYYTGSSKTDKIKLNTAKKFQYNGVTVQAHELTPEVREAVNQLIKDEKAEGKVIPNQSITMSDAKEGLEQHLNQLVNSKQVSIDDIKKEYKLSNNEIVK